MYSKKYDSLLKEISHYKNYPSLLPFIGANFDSPKSPRILIIAESHYLPEDSIVSRNAEEWYNSNYKILSVEEQRWMHTRDLVSCDWKPAGHMIFRELENKLGKIIEKYDDRAMNTCVYINGFQRPSPATGDSIKYFCKEIYFIKSAEVLNSVIEIVKPKLVIFVSKYAWDSLGWRVSKNHPEVKFNFVCHPGTGGIYWHNKNYAHGSEKFSKLVIEANNLL